MPAINKPIQYFSSNTWNGSGTSTVTVDLGFQPDLVWIKPRNNVASNANSHILIDSVRGSNKVLRSDTTGIEVTESNNVTAFTSTGITIGDSHNVNKNTTSQYVVWGWKAGGEAVTNNSGNVTSQVSASTTSGFSICTFTKGNVSNQTFGHGLGVAPKFIIIKNRGATSDWWCYHESLGNTKSILLNSTSAASTDTTYWNSTSPTSTVVTMGTYWSGGNYLAYCFAAVAGYSAFESYTGNGSTDGPFVYTGFRPRYILIKKSSAASTTYGWQLYDTARSPYNTSTLPGFWADTSAAEAANTYGIDLLSNGFKIRDSNINMNANGETMIYAAFAEFPFKYALAR